MLHQGTACCGTWQSATELVAPGVGQLRHFGSRYGHSADHQHQKPPNRFGAFVLHCLGLKQKP